MPTSDSFIHAVAGGTGAVLSISALYPFETARTRIQVEEKKVEVSTLGYIRKIYRDEGLAGIYRGWRSVTFSQFATCAIYFYLFHWLRGSTCVGVNVNNQSVCNDLLFGCYAGIIGVLVTNPLWVINTRLKLQGAKLSSDVIKNTNQPPYTGTIDCLLKMIKYEGVLSLWNGLIPSLILVSNPAIQFMVYEGLKRQTLLLTQTQELTAAVAFIYGAISKSAATIATYPLQVIQTRVRAGTKVLPEDCRIFSVKTLSLFFRGLEAKLTQTALNAALMFLFYEKIKIAIVSFVYSIT